MFESVDLVRLFSAEIYAKYKNLQMFLKRFFDLPPITRYYTVKNGLRWPFTARMAHWGGEDMEPPKHLNNI